MMEEKLIIYCVDLILLPHDAIVRQRGKNTLEQIHYYLIEKAKMNLLNSSDSISQIAYELGFEYPQHFSKLFKLKSGLSPTEFRNMN